MTKIEFIGKLRSGLSGLPDDDIEERLSFYSEMIDDKIEEGVSEEEALLSLGTAEEVLEEILADIPLAKIVKNKIKPKRKIRVWEIVLLAAGSPIWLSLLIALFAVVISIYVVLWSVIISLWAVFASFVGSGVGSVLSGVAFIFTDNVIPGIAVIGAGIVLAGLSIFMFFACKTATKGILILTKKIFIGIKKCFVGKGEV